MDSTKLNHCKDLCHTTVEQVKLALGEIRRAQRSLDPEDESLATALEWIEYARSNLQTVAINLANAAELR